MVLRAPFRPCGGVSPVLCVWSRLSRVMSLFCCCRVWATLCELVAAVFVVTRVAGGWRGVLRGMRGVL